MTIPTRILAILRSRSVYEHPMTFASLLAELHKGDPRVDQIDLSDAMRDLQLSGEVELEFRVDPDPMSRVAYTAARTRETDDTPTLGLSE